MNEKINFQNLGLSAEVLKAVLDLGFEETTPIQSQSIPHVLAGHDFIGQAITGSGKTAAFGLPIADMVVANVKSPQALVLCPTRELAIQISVEFAKFLKYKAGVKVLPIYGGQSIEKQFKDLRSGPQIIIGTPGRVIDHLHRKSLDFSLIKMVVLDEADEMLKMGFREDLEEILQKIPTARQTVLFSATMPHAILQLAQKYQKKDVKIVKITHEKLTAPDVEQFYFEINHKDKIELLSRLIDLYNPKRSIVFCNTKNKVDDVAVAMRARGYKVDGIHGDLNQSQRDRVMARFRSFNVDVLIATGVAARGLDIPSVEAVFNYDIPQDEESYVHRIGRTGRAGKSGRAFSFVGEREHYELRDIVRYTKAKITQLPLPTLKQIQQIKESKVLEDVKAVLTQGHLEGQAELVEILNRENFSIELIAAALLKMLQEKELKYKKVATKDTFENYSDNRRSIDFDGDRDGRRNDNRRRDYRGGGSRGRSNGGKFPRRSSGGHSDSRGQGYSSGRNSK
ncbi:TPA: ATP-dependent RNA helicase [Candidatus Dependentiae bacterium]|nr:MAG: Cold-shock DEAD-box protein A [candidate division TM6 bacterium GW2011_GWF2_33_332]HBS48110.1 ATP-dependent RNA helicase [Candidatus Dependentiae bacterium]HBZ73534.1 ATP-dependent RNA helicase [Candidatus Dependentiae bacterium]